MGKKRTHFTLSYDADNRLVEYSGGGVSAAFLYDGDGRRVKGAVNTITTLYVNDYYEIEGTTVRKYYSAGGQRIAVQENGVLSYLLTDHLGSITVSLDGQNLTGTRSYSSWGETRGSAGTLPTARGYQGQYAENELGLLFFNARWGDPELGRFISADSLIPEPGNPGDWDRYAFVLNNPIRYSDPSGHKVWDGCSGETGGCAGKRDYADYVYGVWHTDQEREQNRENIETAVEVGTTIIGVVNEPTDWAITATYCVSGDCSPLMLLGLLPIIPSSIGVHANDIIGLLPTPKLQKHHIFPKQFEKRFERVGIKINQHTVLLSEGVHLKGLHGKGGFVGPGDKLMPIERWNGAWQNFFDTNPNPSSKEIYQFGGQLMDAYGLSGLTITPY